MLETADKIAVLGKYVDWEGFNDAQKRSVIQRVVGGDSPEFWMDGITAEDPEVSTVKTRLEKALLWRPQAGSERTGEHQGERIRAMSTDTVPVLLASDVVAAMLGVSERTLWRLLSAGRMPRPVRSVAGPGGVWPRSGNGLTGAARPNRPDTRVDLNV